MFLDRTCLECLRVPVSGLDNKSETCTLLLSEYSSTYPQSRARLSMKSTSSVRLQVYSKVTASTRPFSILCFRCLVRAGVEGERLAQNMVEGCRWKIDLFG